MILENFQILNELNMYSILLRIILAVILGGLLGIEREQKQRPAGFRTYVIVCLGSTLACITNIYMHENIGGSDPSRIPAQVISGIGFLGAGTILVTRRNHIKGLTTAASLWCAATIGIAVGCGFYSGAIICSVVIVLSLRLLSFVDTRFTRYNKYICLYAEYNNSEFIHLLITYCAKQSYRLHELEIYNTEGHEINYATFTVKIQDASLRTSVINQLREFNGCVLLEELSN